MIISKSSLQVLLVTKNDKIPVLNNIHIREDGTTIGSNGKTILAVSPVGAEARNTLKDHIGDDPLSSAITVAEETAKDVLKNIPKDTQFKGLLEHCNVKIDPESDRGVEFTMTDGKRPKVIKGKRWMRDYIQYEEVFARVAATRKEMKIVLNRRRLMSLLDAIDKACPDSTGNSPVYIEFSDQNDIVVRSVNYANGQRVMGVMQSYKGIEGQWLEEGEWERSLCGKDKLENTSVQDTKSIGTGTVVPVDGSSGERKMLNKVVGAKVPKAVINNNRKIPKAKSTYWEADKNK